MQQLLFLTFLFTLCYSCGAPAPKESPAPPSQTILPQVDLKYFRATWAAPNRHPIIKIEFYPNRIVAREAWGTDAISGIKYDLAFHNGELRAMGNPKDFPNNHLPTFQSDHNGGVLYSTGTRDIQLQLLRQEIPNVIYKSFDEVEENKATKAIPAVRG